MKQNPRVEKLLNQLIETLLDLREELLGPVPPPPQESDDDSWDEEDTVHDEAEDPDSTIGEDAEDDSRTSDIDVVPL